MSYTVCKYKVPCPDLDDAYVYDKYINSINEQKKVRENLILEKLKSLKENGKDNELLEDVKKEYEEYIKQILNEREEEKSALKNISNYIDKIIVDGGLTNEDLEQSKKENEEINNEIERIKKELDELYLLIKC